MFSLHMPSCCFPTVLLFRPGLFLSCSMASFGFLPGVTIHRPPVSFSPLLSLLACTHIGQPYFTFLTFFYFAFVDSHFGTLEDGDHESKGSQLMIFLWVLVIYFVISLPSSLLPLLQELGQVGLAISKPAFYIFALYK